MTASRWTRELSKMVELIGLARPEPDGLKAITHLSPNCGDRPLKVGISALSFRPSSESLHNCTELSPNECAAVCCGLAFPPELVKKSHWQDNIVEFIKSGSQLGPTGGACVGAVCAYTATKPTRCHQGVPTTSLRAFLRLPRRGRCLHRPSGGRAKSDNRDPETWRRRLPAGPDRRSAAEIATAAAEAQVGRDGSFSRRSIADGTGKKFPPKETASSPRLA